MPINFENLIEEFNDSLRWESGLAKRSCNQALCTVREWVHWLEEHKKTWLAASTMEANDFMGEKIELLARSTVDCKIWALKRLYRWALDRQLVSTNPFADFCTAFRRGERYLAYVPSIRMIETLLEQPDPHSPIGVRDRACLELLYGAGIRAQELLNLQLRCLHIDERWAIVKGKGNKERIVVFGEMAACWLQRYLDIRSQIPILAGVMGHRVFIHRRGPLNYDMLRSLVHWYAQRCGLRLMTPHTLRHAFATHLYQRGVDLRAIQLMLGHVDLRTTTIYTHVMRDEVREILEIHHPRGSRYQNWERDRNGVC